MVRPLKELHGFQIEATDGILGRVAGAYFDDDRWTVRYLVVKTGSWLDAREVLISPTVLGAANGQTRTLAARLSKKQVEDSPPIDLERPVSRQQEAEVGDHYGWPAYWERGLWESHVPAIMAAMQANGNEPAPPDGDGDPQLRRTREMIGYHLHAIDGTLGHVEDFIIDDETWTVRYLAVVTSSWWFGGHVLISPRWIRAVRWPERVVDLAVTRDVIKHSPAWKPGYPITQDYEDNLVDYYRHRQAWSVVDRTRPPSCRAHGARDGAFRATRSRYSFNPTASWPDNSSRPPSSACPASLRITSSCASRSRLAPKR